VSAATGLTPGQTRIVNVINDAGPDDLTRNEIARQAMVSPASVKVMICHIRRAGHEIRSTRQENSRARRNDETYWMGPRL
tara:strand:+ start:487 stop:726 length:240 start_codon:yes stop_codon:yes gene_type:complete